MKLSNTMIINCEVMPTKKAFTLAEVLITLSILGVVAALTIPSLVNRQSQMAAITKMKKAISQYEQVVEVYMAENEAKDFSTAAASCNAIKGYFKTVADNGDSSGCVFTTADGVVWSINSAGTVLAYDSNSPKFGVVMWARNGVVNGTGSNALNKPVQPTAAPVAAPTATASGKPVFAATSNSTKYYNAAQMLKIGSPADLTANPGATSVTTTGNGAVCPTVAS